MLGSLCCAGRLSATPSPSNWRCRQRCLLGFGRGLLCMVTLNTSSCFHPCLGSWAAKARGEFCQSPK